MAEYASPFSIEEKEALLALATARGAPALRRLSDPPEEEGFEADPYQQTIETENFILTFTGPLSDVVTQLQRRVLIQND